MKLVAMLKMHRHRDSGLVQLQLAILIDAKHYVINMSN